MTMIKTNSAPLILNGREVSIEVLEKIKSEVKQLKTNNKRVPGLAVLIAGNNPASLTYVKNKEKTAKEIGLYSKVYKLPDTISEFDLIKQIELLNVNENIDGILVQLPLPHHIKAEDVISYVNPQKDVDGLHPLNAGKLFSGEQSLMPCTPKGVIEILKFYKINLAGLNSVVIGRSNLVGKPLALLLLRENATVTIIHSKSKNIKEITKNADLLVCAIGQPKFVKENWVKDGAIVIDIGINKISEGGSSKLVGDVDFENVSRHCKAITPVPGGVGPVTIAMLMSNTLDAYKMRNRI